MRRTVLTIFAAALLAGSFAQAASAKEHQKQHHHVRKAQRAPVVTSQSYQSYRNSNAAIWPGPAVQPDWSRYYHDEALSPPAGH
jgi:Ni/Co efflux regulator RcnB